jgi:hypothetical protein
MPAKAKWTVLTYIAAHNNLQPLGKASRDQIVQVGSTAEVAHGVLYDGARGAARYLVGDAGLALEGNKLGEFDSGDPDQLVETARWLFAQRPAERYGLVLWSHGSGWQPEEVAQVARQARGDDAVGQAEATQRSGGNGAPFLFRSTVAELVQPDAPADRAILFDDGSGHSLDTLELDRVMRAVAAAIGQPLDLLGMDACLMANLEVAYQLRDSVRYLVASEGLVPGHSWPYDTIYGGLRARPDQSAADLGRAIVRQYTDFYTANPPGAGDVTKVALDLSEVGPVAEAVNGLAAALFGAFPAAADLLWHAQATTQKRETDGYRLAAPTKFDFNLWDVGAVAKELAGPSSLPPVRAPADAVVQRLRAGGDFVLAEGHRGAWYDGIGGVSIYLSKEPDRQPVTKYYGDLAFAQPTTPPGTTWLELLRRYEAG